MKPPAAWSEPRTAIVTGGGSGIGLAIANRLAAEGATVAIWDRDGATAEAAAKGIEAEGGKAIVFPVDITDRSAIDAAVAELRDGVGAATIIVNNAGISPFKKFLEIEREDLQQVIDVNVIGTFDCCQAVVPDMIAAGWGRIVNIASSSAQTGSPLQTHYSASKGAVIALTRSLAVALGSEGHHRQRGAAERDRHARACAPPRKVASSDPTVRCSRSRCRCGAWASPRTSRRCAPSSPATTWGSSPGR